MALDLGIIQRPIGPLPLWAWGALLGGGAILFASARGHHPVAQAVMNPDVATPAAPGDTSGGGVTGGASPPSQVLEPGQTTGNPVSIADLLGGQSFADFLHTLGPNYTQATINAGSLGASVQNSAQNILDEQSVLASYHAAEVNNTNFYAANVASNAAFWNAWASYWHDRPNYGPGPQGFGFPTTPGVTASPSVGTLYNWEPGSARGDGSAAMQRRRWLA